MTCKEWEISQMSACVEENCLTVLRGKHLKVYRIQSQALLVLSFLRSYMYSVRVREGAPKRQSNCASDQSLKCDYLSWRHPSAGKVSHLRGNEVKVREVLGLRPLLLTVIANHQMILTYNSKNKHS